MYRINPLYRNVLITTDEVIYHSPTRHTLDPRTVQQAIIVAEERFLRPALCYDLYEELVTKKNVTITAGNLAAMQIKYDASKPPGAPAYILKEGDVINAWEELLDDQKNLWKEQLWKLTAECVMLLATPEAFVQFSSEGVVHGSPPANLLSTGGVTTPDLRSVKWVMDKKMMDRIDPLLEALHVWLCKQRAADKTKFTNYCKECECDLNGVAYRRKSDIITGLYDEDVNACACE